MNEKADGDRPEPGLQSASDQPVDPGIAALNLTAEAEAKSLERLYDYTKFHIGVYLTLLGAYVAIATARIDGQSIIDIDIFYLVVATLCFMTAGLAGGIIVSSLTKQVGGSGESFLENEIIGPELFPSLHWSAQYWANIEHSSFWIGVSAALLSIAVQ